MKNGIYEFNRMPFRLCNGPATYQKAVDLLFNKEDQGFVILYLDDTIVFSKTLNEHIKNIKYLLSKMHAAGFSLNSNKCKILKISIKILGHVVTEN